MSAALEALIRTQEALSVPTNWTRGENAKNAEGKPVPFDDPAATCHCLNGRIALETAAKPVMLMMDSAYQQAWTMVRDAAQELYGVSPIVVNDDLGHESMLRVLSRAIVIGQATSNPVLA